MSPESLRKIGLNPERFHRLQRVLNRRQPDLTVLMENVNKSHNFSAILRNCDATGVLDAHAVLPKKGINLSKHTSGGTSKWVRVQPHGDTDAAIAHLHKDGFSVLAAHPGEDAIDFREVDYTQKVAVMVGAELDGLTERGLALADKTVSIPMAGMARSLNVSVATAMILFEAFRQRQEAGMYETSRLSEERYEELLFEWTHPQLAEALRERSLPYPPLSPEGEVEIDSESLRD